MNLVNGDCGVVLLHFKLRKTFEFVMFKIQFVE